MIDPGAEGEIFSIAIDLPAEERDSFLELKCGDNTGLRNAVQELIDLHDTETDFLETPLGDFTLTELSEQAGDAIGNYRLEEAIGEGGFGVVWRATQTKPVQREVAIKVVKLGMEFNQITERFSAERQTLAILNHPNIATVFDAGVTDSGRLYFVMELVDGPTLDEWAKDKPMPVVLQVFAIICRAVQHAHHKGIIHCDLKPSNILISNVDSESIPKVIDFGIAKAIEETPESAGGSRTAVGTPRYMSPEQLARLPDIDTRSDVFSLGVILAELSELKGARKQPAEIRWIAEKARQSDPENRYQTASELANDIERQLRGIPVIAAPKSVGYQLRKFISRNRTLVGVSSIAGGLLTLTFIGVLLSLLHARQQTKIANEQRAIAIKEREAADKQRTIALEEAKESRMVSEYLKGLIHSADPQKGNPSDYLFRDHLEEIAVSLDTLSEYPDVEAELRLTIARAYHNLSQLTKARVHYQRALEIYFQKKGPTDEQTIECKIGYSSCLIRLRESEEAEKHLQAVLSVVESESSSLNHIKVLLTLARLRQQQVQFEEALKLSSDAYDLSRNARGEKDKFTLHALNSCAVISGKLGRLEDAELFGRKVLKIFEEHSPTRKFTIANSRYKLAHILLECRKWEEAYAMATQACAEFVELLGVNDEHVIRTLCLRSQLCLLLNNREEAADLAEQAVSTAIQLPENQIEIRATAWRRQAETLSATDPAQSAAAWNQAIRFRIQHVGENPQVASHLMKYARVLEKLEKIDEALECLEQSIEILEKFDRPTILKNAKRKFELLLLKKSESKAKNRVDG